MWKQGRAVVALMLASSCSVGFAANPRSAQSGSEASQLPEWRLKHLAVLHELDFCTSNMSPSPSTVRFLWLRTFHHPVVIVATLKGDGTGMVMTEISSGAGGYSPGKLSKTEKRDLSAQDVEDLLAQLKRVDFWKMLTTEEGSRGVDGAEWILEVRERNKCHVVNRWSPESGAYKEFCLFLIERVSGLRIPKREIY